MGVHRNANAWRDGGTEEDTPGRLLIRELMHHAGYHEHYTMERCQDCNPHTMESGLYKPCARPGCRGRVYKSGGSKYCSAVCKDICLRLIRSRNAQGQYRKNGCKQFGMAHRKRGGA